MIIQYPQLLNNEWLRQGCFVGSLKKPNDIYTVTSIVKKYGVKIKCKPYNGLLSLSQIYYIPKSYVYYNGNKFLLTEDFNDFFQKNRNRLLLKYKQGIAQCNICKKVQSIIDYYGNGCFFCKQCSEKKNQISNDNILNYIDLKQPINYSIQILFLINLFSEICFQKMNDINKIEKFIGYISNILIKNNKISKIKCLEIINLKTNQNYNICKLKDEIFMDLCNCFLALHNGTKKNKYIQQINNNLYEVLNKFIIMKQIKNKI